MSVNVRQLIQRIQNDAQNLIKGPDGEDLTFVDSPNMYNNGYVVYSMMKIGGKDAVVKMDLTNESEPVQITVAVNAPGVYNEEVLQAALSTVYYEPKLNDPISYGCMEAPGNSGFMIGMSVSMAELAANIPGCLTLLSDMMMIAAEYLHDSTAAQ